MNPFVLNIVFIQNDYIQILEVKNYTLIISTAGMYKI